MNRVEEAVSCFNSGLCWSQAVLCTYGKPFGLDHHMAVRLGAGFCGGMGRMAGTCGAVTGAYMVLGLSAGGNSGRQGPKTKGLRNRAGLRRAVYGQERLDYLQGPDGMRHQYPRRPCLCQ